GGRRRKSEIYLTNSLYLAWDAQFYPEGLRGWAVKIDANPEGGMQLDPRFFLLRPLQAAGSDVASPLGGNAGPVSAACPLVISDGDSPRSRSDAGPHPAEDAVGHRSDRR